MRDRPWAAAKRVTSRAQHAAEADEIRTTAGVGERILQLVVVEDGGGPGCGSKAQQDRNGALSAWTEYMVISCFIGRRR